jgi:hypothetical protein
MHVRATNMAAAQLQATIRLQGSDRRGAAARFAAESARRLHLRFCHPQLYLAVAGRRAGVSMWCDKV